MRRTALLLGLALVACGDDPAPAGPQPRAGTTQQKPERAAPVPAPTLPAAPRAESLGAWRPDPADLALAARLGDPATRDDAWIEIGDLPRDRWVRVLRAGLRLDDVRAAYQCAVELSWEHLDAAEMSRVCRLIFEANFDRSIAAPDDPESLAEPYEAASSADVAWLCERFLATPPEAWPSTAGLAQLHKGLRADAAGAVLRLAALPASREDAEIRDLAAQILGYADAGRPDFADVMAPGAAASSPAPGLPPALAVLLDRDLSNGGGRSLPGEGAWSIRWLAEARPGPADVALLRRLHDRGEYDTPRLLLALRDAAPAELGEELRRMLPPEGPETGDPTPLGTLLDRIARSGGRLGTADLSAWALSEGDAMALALAWSPAETRAFVLDAVRSPDDEGDPISLVESLRHADERRAEHGLPVPDDLVPGFADALPAPDAWYAFRMPWARTRSAADRILANLGALDLSSHPSGMDALGALEAHDRERTVAALRAIRADPRHEERDLAERCLALLGDEEALLAQVADGATSPCRRFRGAGPRVREALAAALRDRETSATVDGILSLALCDLGASGPPDLAFEHAIEEESADILRAAAEHAIAGRPVDALLAVCAASDPELVEGMGALRDPRIGALLRSRLDARHTETYAGVVGELVLHGDEAARAEQVAVIRAGHYRWIDEMRSLHRDLGDPVAALPLWIEVVASNCCQKVGAQAWIEDRFEVDVGALSGPLRSDASILRDWMRRYRSRLRWSDIAGKYVVAPQ